MMKITVTLITLFLTSNLFSQEPQLSNGELKTEKNESKVKLKKENEAKINSTKSNLLPQAKISDTIRPKNGSKELKPKAALQSKND